MPRIRGQSHYRTHLTENDVRRIRAEYRPGEVTYSALAAKYGITEQTVGKIINRITWRHV